MAGYFIEKKFDRTHFETYNLVRIIINDIKNLKKENFV